MRAWPGTPVSAQAASGGPLACDKARAGLADSSGARSRPAAAPVVRISLLEPRAAGAQGVSGRNRAQVTSERPQWAGQVLERGLGEAHQSISGMGQALTSSRHQRQPGRLPKASQASDRLRSGYRGCNRRCRAQVWFSITPLYHLVILAKHVPEPTHLAKKSMHRSWHMCCFAFALGRCL